MLRLLSSLLLGSSLLLATTHAEGNADEELKKKPITRDSGEVGKLLQKWWQEGTAAGNVGDWYDNRDGDHSPLDLRPYPQLQKIPYMLVVGDRESADGTVSVRTRAGGDQGSRTLDAFIASAREEIAHKGKAVATA